MILFVQQKEIISQNNVIFCVLVFDLSSTDKDVTIYSQVTVTLNSGAHNIIHISPHSSTHAYLHTRTQIL